MSLKQNLESLKAIFNELAYYKTMNALSMWDQWNGLPPKGMPFRQKAQSYFAGKRAELIASDNVKYLAKYFQNISLDELENPIDRAIVRSFLHTYQYQASVPVERTKELVALSGESQAAWVKAKQEKDYEIFKPFLKKMVGLQLEIAKAIDPNRNPFEVLVGSNDEGLSLPEANREFEKLKKAVAEIIKKINATGVEIDDTFLQGNYDKETLFEFAKFVTQQIGYDLNQGGYGQVIHPFTNIFGPKDARITVNCANYKLGVFGAIHEAGHAMYAYRGNDEVNAANLWGGIPSGFHESQSRFYENIIGKSKAFWQYIYPEAQKRFPALASVSLEDYYKAINLVKTSTNRITADEVTYSLHPIIRFELEQDLLNGKVDFDDLPAAWNKKYVETLGVHPKDDEDGVLQDIHWAAGALGYFQSYTLGNIYGGQIRATLLKDLPDTYNEIAVGNFAPLNEWLTENVHQYSFLYTGTEMLKKVTGEALNADYFIAYLNEKYSKIYGYETESV